MKTILMGFVMAMSFSAMAAGHSCQKYAETVAINEMNQELAQEVKPEKLTEVEKAQLSRTTFLTASGDDSNLETGIYSVELSVMEECLDGLKVETRLVNKGGEQSCELIKVSSLGQRDCG